MNKEIESKFSLKTRLALALSTLAFVTAGCGNFKSAPSYGDCLNAGGSNEQCLEIWDSHALQIKQTAEAASFSVISKATQQAKNYEAQQIQLANEDLVKEATKNAPRHKLAKVQPGEGILDVLVRMGYNLEATGPMNYSQIIAVTINGQFRLVTLGELLNSDPSDPQYHPDSGACVITALDQYGINQGIEQNTNQCPTQ